MLSEYQLFLWEEGGSCASGAREGKVWERAGGERGRMEQSPLELQG